jgi:hypothetical protein
LPISKARGLPINGISGRSIGTHFEIIAAVDTDELSPGNARATENDPCDSDKASEASNAGLLHDFGAVLIIPTLRHYRSRSKVQVQHKKNQISTTIVPLVESAVAVKIDNKLTKGKVTRMLFVCVFG